MAQAFLGEIRMVGFNFAPVGWALCNGQLLSIQQNAALFALLGTTYGGNGITNFQLPNLQGRVPVHTGNLSGGQSYVLGQFSGAETVSLLTSNLPNHSHATLANSGPATTSNPSGAVLAVPGDGNIYTTTAPNATMSASSSTAVGNNLPVDIRQPYLVMNFIIALTGVFPSRN